VLKGLVAPVEAELETEDHAEHTLTQQRYEQAVATAPNNSLILANFTQFRLAVLLLSRSLP
jgi:Tfp pilus assembly protein PilF